MTESSNATALAKLETVFGDDPTSAVFADLARALHHAGDDHRACEILLAGLHHHPNHVEARLLLGEYLLAQNDNRAVTHEMAQLLTIAPHNVQAMKLLAHALLADEQVEEAWVVLRRAQENAPEDTEVRALLQRAAQLSQSDADSVDESVPVRRPPPFTGYIQTVADAPNVDSKTEEVNVIIDQDYRSELGSDQLDSTRPISDPFEKGAPPASVFMPELTRGDDQPPQLDLEEPDPHPETGGFTREALSPGLRRELLRQMEQPDDATRPLEQSEIPAPTPIPPIFLDDLNAQTSVEMTIPQPPPLDPESDPPASFTDQMEITAGMPSAAPAAASIDVEFDESLNETTLLPAVSDLDLGSVDLPPTRAQLSPGLVRGDRATNQISRDPVHHEPLDLPQFEWETSESTEQLSPIADPQKADASQHGAGPSTVNIPGRGAVAPVRRVPISEPVPVLPPTMTISMLDAEKGLKAANPDVDLLDIPMDPGEFADLPPKPKPRQRHALPPDLQSGMNAVKQTPVARKKAQPPKKPPIHQPPQPRQLTRPPVVRAKAVRAKPALPKPALPKPVAVRPAQARPIKKVPRPPEPKPQPAFLDIPPAPVSAQSQPVFEPQTRAQLAEDLSRRRISTWQIVLAALTVLLLIFSAVVTWRYRSASRQSDQLLTNAYIQLADDNFASRLLVSTTLAEAPSSPDLLAKLGDAVVRMLGKPGLKGRLADRRALQARIAAERVAEFGERLYLPDAKALYEPIKADTDRPNTVLAGLYLTWVQSGPAAVAQRIEALPASLKESANILYLDASSAAALGQTSRAIDRARTALQRDDRHLKAQKLLIDLQAQQGETTAALDAYNALLQTVTIDHLNSRIALLRLRIKLDKRAEEAQSVLVELAERPATVISPYQRALIYDGIGVYHTNRSEIESARSAFRRAFNEMPDDPRFATGLARLDLQAFQLDAAEAALRKAAAADPTSQEYDVELAKVAFLRGDSQEALKRLKPIERLSVDGEMIRGRALLRIGKFDAANAAFMAASRLDPDLLDPLIYRRFISLRKGDSKVLTELKGYRSKRPEGQRLNDLTLPFRIYGMALARTQKKKQARAEFKRAIQGDERDYLSRYELCYLEFMRQQPRNALKACIAALSVNPQFAPAASLSGEIAEYMDSPVQVIEVMSELGIRGVLSSKDVRRLARAYVKRKDFSAALALVGGKKTDSGTERFVRGLVGVVQSDSNDALTELYNAAEELEKDAWVLLVFADQALRMGRTDRALAYYRRAIKRTKRPEPALGAARATLHQGKLAEARRFGKLAITRSAYRITTDSLKAEAYAIQGLTLVSGSKRERKKAAKLFKKANKVKSDLSTTLLGQALLFEVQEETKKAAKLYRRLIDRDPKNAEPRFRLGRMLVNQEATKSAGRTILVEAQKLDKGGRWGLLATAELKRTQ